MVLKSIKMNKHHKQFTFLFITLENHIDYLLLMFNMEKSKQNNQVPNDHLLSLIEMFYLYEQ